MISVVIPAFNASAYLPQTLDSILGQKDVALDVILVDDGSTDHTSEAVRAYNEGGVRYVRISNSGGPARPRNVGLAHARGEIVALFDADDIMLPGKLATAAALFERHPETDLLFTDYDAIDADGRLLEQGVMRRYQQFRRIATPIDSQPESLRLDPARTYEELLRSNFVATSSVVARRQVLEAEGGFDEQFKNADDVDMWYRLARRRRQFLYVDDSGHQYRRHSSSISGGGARRLFFVNRMLEKQQAFPCSRIEAERLDHKLYRARMAFGWALRQEGRYKRARDVYATALRQKRGLEALKGVVVTTCLHKLRRRRRRKRYRRY